MSEAKVNVENWDGATSVEEKVLVLVLWQSSRANVKMFNSSTCLVCKTHLACFKTGNQIKISCRPKMYFFLKKKKTIGRFLAERVRDVFLPFAYSARVAVSILLSLHVQ